MKKILLTKGKETLIDDEDFDLVNQYKWQTSSWGYAVHSQKIPKTRNCYQLKMHNLIMNPSKDKQVDHINRNPLDNRRENLRIVSPEKNSLNRSKQKNNTSGYKGVDKQVSGWRARVTVNNKLKFIGYFKEVRWAAMAYDIWAKELHKEFGNFNFN